VIESPQDGDDCWATKLGYRCCVNASTEVIIIDKDGQWGVEYGEWCGIN
jgi:hypothetical protein